MMVEGEHGIRLLLVDSEESYLDVLAKRLAKRGLKPMTANHGVAAIQALRRYRFDVAVIDLKMEDMDGIELLKVLKRMDPDLPVIILTGHDTERSIRESSAWGAYEYLLKPCDLETLIAKIRTAQATRAGTNRN
ncbi:MAG: response regulator [Thermodesulfobacteriota bacterium]